MPRSCDGRELSRGDLRWIWSRTATGWDDSRTSTRRFLRSTATPKTQAENPRIKLFSVPNKFDESHWKNIDLILEPRYNLCKILKLFPVKSFNFFRPWKNLFLFENWQFKNVFNSYSIFFTIFAMPSYLPTSRIAVDRDTALKLFPEGLREMLR